MGNDKKIFGFNKNVFVLSFVSFFTDLSNEMLLRTAPLFLANVLGTSISIIGLIEGVAESMSTILKVFSGWLSDVIGKRKVLTVIGYSLSFMSKPIMFFAGSWPVIFLAKFTDRVGKGIRTSPRDALIADSASAHDRGKAFGLHRTIDPLGAVLGTALAGVFVLQSSSDRASMSAAIFKALVVVSLIPALISVLLLIIGVKEPGTSKNKLELPVKPKLLSFRGMDRNLVVFLVVNVIFTMGNSSDTFLVLRAQKVGTTIAGIFFMLAISNGVSAILALPAGKLSDKVGRKKPLVFGWVIYSLVYLGFGYARTPGQIWLLFLFYGAYYGITDGAARALIADMVDCGQRGTAYGLYNASIGISVLPASLLAGVMWDKLGSQFPFIFGAALSIIAVMGLVLFVREGAPAEGLVDRGPGN